MMIKRSAILTGCLLLTACVSTPEENYALPVTEKDQPHLETQRLGDGLLLSSEKPLKVVASRGGQVLEVTGSRQDGRTVVVDHGGGVKTTYSNLSKVNVRRGSWVKSGRKIGKVTKGENDVATLGFELSLAKASIDPMAVIEVPEVELKKTPPVKVTFDDKPTKSETGYKPGYDKYGPIPGYKGPSAEQISSGPQKKAEEPKYAPGYDKYGPIPGWKG